jgi:hypothetical protein
MRGIRPIEHFFVLSAFFCGLKLVKGDYRGNNSDGKYRNQTNDNRADQGI